MKDDNLQGSFVLWVDLGGVSASQARPSENSLGVAWANQWGGNADVTNRTYVFLV